MALHVPWKELEGYSFCLCHVAGVNEVRIIMQLHPSKAPRVITTAVIIERNATVLSTDHIDAMAGSSVVVVSPEATPNAGRRRENTDSARDNKRPAAKKGLFELFIFCAAIVAGTACSISSKVLYELKGVGSDGTLQTFDKRKSLDRVVRAVVTPLAELSSPTHASSLVSRVALCQTFGMFVAMVLGLPLHWIFVYSHIPFPGYEQFKKNRDNEKETSSDDLTSTEEERERLIAAWKSKDDESALESSSQSSLAATTVPIKMYFVLAIPAVFDLATTALCMIGLVYLDVSIYQLLRGSGIIFTALFRTWAFQQPLYRFQWLGVVFNLVSIVLVGLTALLNSSTSPEEGNLQEVIFAIVIMLLGTCVQSMQFVFEEKVMTNDDEIKVPPLLLFGMEGVWYVWLVSSTLLLVVKVSFTYTSCKLLVSFRHIIYRGTILCVTILYPIGCAIPGKDNGMFEDPWNTWVLLQNTRSIQIVMTIYILAVFSYNLFAVQVTFLLSSVWHSILVRQGNVCFHSVMLYTNIFSLPGHCQDNFRPMTVWITDLCIYYVITNQTFGEEWSKYSWIQLAGMIVLITGTMIYNAPDGGSLLLQGQWYCLGIDYTDEYNEVRAQRLFGMMGSYPSMRRFMLASTRSLHSHRRTKREPSIHRVVHSPKGNALVPRVDYGSRGFVERQQSV